MTFRPVAPRTICLGNLMKGGTAKFAPQVMKRDLPWLVTLEITSC